MLVGIFFACLFVCCFCCLFLATTSVHSTCDSLFSRNFINEGGPNLLGIDKVHFVLKGLGPDDR